jgi:hypothetical protein
MDSTESSQIESTPTASTISTTSISTNEINQTTVIPDSIENENKIDNEIGEQQQQQLKVNNEMKENGDKIDQDKTEKLFSNITYYIINSNKTDIGKLLDDNGAKQDNYLGDFVTHVICDEFSTDNFDCNEAKDVFELKIVKSDWVIKCLYANSLLP